MKTINTARIIEALRNVKAEESVRVFCSALADRIGDGLTAKGLALEIDLFVYDLNRGKSWYAAKPIPASLFGYPFPHDLLRHEAERFMTIAASPEDFDAVAAVFGLSDDPTVRSLNNTKRVPPTEAPS